MPAFENVKIREYSDLIELVAKIEFQKLSDPNLLDLPEMINIATHAVYILFKNNSAETYNQTYLSTAIKWAIRNEIRRRCKWYSVKKRKDNEGNGEDNNSENSKKDEKTAQLELRLELYKNILSIDQLTEGEIPTQIKSEDQTPDEVIEFVELRDGIKKSLRKIPQRERELIEAKFFKDKKLKEIAEEFNVSQSRISRIIQTGLDRIKKDLRNQGVI